jgi:hypothetical protein
LDPTDVLRLFDPDSKVWFSLEGEMFDSYAKAAAEAWRPQEGAQEAAEPAEPEVDPFGVGQEPQRPRWRPAASIGGDPPRR